MYALTLTESELDTISFVGNRYEWSKVLQDLNEGLNEISEHKAWEIGEAIESDMEGGHDAFPMLDTRSESGYRLVEKILAVADKYVR